MTKKARWSSLSSEAPSGYPRVADPEGAGRAAPDAESESESEEEFAFSRNYFLAKELGGKSRRKTARKVSDINPVDEQALRAASSGLVAKHEKEIRELLNSYKDLYPKWLFELRCGFGILTYGFGSKKTLLEDFASSTLTNYSVVVINGYLQKINLKQCGTRRWFIANLTGAGTMCQRSYPISTVQNAKTALIVLQSLTPNAQCVFKALAEYQLAHPKDEGMPMNALYSVCRERFLVSSQVTLNSHLVEFKDHDLIKIRRNSEGQDCYYVPLSAEALEKLLQELN